MKVGPKLIIFVWRFLLNNTLKIIEKIKRIHSKSLLRICRGPRIEMRYLAKMLSLLVIGLDLSRSMACQAKLKEGIFDVIIGDGESLPLRFCSFNIGFVYNGLHHLPGPYLATRELSRVSRDFILKTRE